MDRRIDLVRRMRRLRTSPRVRELVAENHVSTSDFIYPMFVCEGEGIRQEVPSMPGIYRQSIEEVLREMDEVAALDIPAVILFGIPDTKDPQGSGAYADDGIVQRAAAAVRERFGEDLLIVTDVCLCEYTDHGHCAPVKDGRILNDEGVELLCRTAVSQARAGAHWVAPSDMMDGRVGAIRDALDAEGLTDVAILSYAAKYASAFYGPFRDAADSTPQFGDRKTYQMDPANAEEAMREVALDLEEGADLVMIKPALPYLDVVRRVKDAFEVPVAAYNVSGEYAMVKAAAQKGWVDGERVMMESLLSIKRAGASLILTYFAKEAASVLKRS